MEIIPKGTSNWMNKENDKESDCPTHDRFCRFFLSNSILKFVPPVLSLPYGIYKITAGIWCFMDRMITKFYYDQNSVVCTWPFLIVFLSQNRNRCHSLPIAFSTFLLFCNVRKTDFWRDQLSITRIAWISLPSLIVESSRITFPFCVKPRRPN